MTILDVVSCQSSELVFNIPLEHMSRPEAGETHSYSRMQLDSEDVKAN